MNRKTVSIIGILAAFAFAGPYWVRAKGDPPPETNLTEGIILPNSNTVALWLFDELDYVHTTLTDASDYTKADLCLLDGGSMVPGKFGNALRISGTDYALCYAGFAGKVSEEELRERDGTPSALWGPTEGPEALLEALAGDRWTVELWLNLSASTGEISIIDLGQAYESGMRLTLNNDMLLLENHYAGVKLSCPANLLTGTWQHIAMVRRGSQAHYYINGREQAGTRVTSITRQPLPDLQRPDDREHEHRGFKPMSFEQRRQNRFNLAIGSDRHGRHRMKGLVDETRISRVARYRGRFEPKSFSRNYGPNAPAPSMANGPALLFNPEPVSIPLVFGTRKHVFIDDAIFQRKTNVKITMNQPHGKQPIGKDFTIRKSSWRPSVFDVDGKVFMAMPEGYSSEQGKTFLVTSEDGLNFTMQGLILPETPMYGSFFKDLNPAVPPEERYKVNAFVSTRGMYFYTSPDGINWRRNETIQLPLRSGGEGECFWDDQRGRYASYIKRDSSFHNRECPRAGGRVGVGFWTQEILKPWPFHRMATPYFEGYPFPSVTGEGPVSFGVTDAGEAYRIRAIKYPWAPDVYLAFVWRYSSDNDEVRHIDLGISRNGEDWSFFGSNWYIPLGEQEEELTLYGLIRRANEIWQYVDEGGAHGGDAQRIYYRYRQRLDGFVSLDAGAPVGEVTTLPLIFKGNRLSLNIKADGWAKVALTDTDGRILPGFDFDDCDVIKGDFIDKAVNWKSGKQVTEQQGRPVRLKFRMQKAKLYAFEIKDEVDSTIPEVEIPRGDQHACVEKHIAVYDRVSGLGNIDLSRAKVILLNSRSTIQANAANMLVDEIEKRTRIGLEVVTQMSVANTVAIVIGTVEQIANQIGIPASAPAVPQKADGYAIWVETRKRDAAAICLAGYDDRGALFAVGRLLRTMDMGRDTVSVDSGIHVASAPTYSLRGHQMGYRPKTNSYDAWTIERWEQYYRDMIVFGMNAVELAPPVTDDLRDSPHFPKPPLEMMIAMSKLAHEYGLEVWIWYPIMEFDIEDHEEITPELMELALKNRDEVLSRLPHVDAVFVPSGDPDEVHPRYLFPHMKAHKRVLKRYHPHATIWSSVQNYDDEEATMGWIEAFYGWLNSGQVDWFDGVVFGPATEITLPEMRRNVPKRFPIRRYPDITHSKSSQYEVDDWDKVWQRTLGREPINPRPHAYAKVFRDLQQYAMGFISYSEGCNDDLNKVVWSCLGWDPQMQVGDILLEYSRYFISARFAETFAKGLLGLERNWEGRLQDNEGIFETLKLFQYIERNATPQDKLNWRLQQGLYRAYYDAYIKERLAYEEGLEEEALAVLKTAGAVGSARALDAAETILDKAVTYRAHSKLRARVFQMAEALFQSIGLQTSVPRYRAKQISRGANLDMIDIPLNHYVQLQEMFAEIRKMDSEPQKLARIARIAANNYRKKDYDWEEIYEKTFIAEGLMIDD